MDTYLRDLYSSEVQDLIVAPRARTQFALHDALTRYCNVGGGVREVKYEYTTRDESPQHIIDFVKACVDRTMAENEDFTLRSMLWVVLCDRQGTYISTPFMESRTFSMQRVMDVLDRAIQSGNNDYRLKFLTIKYTSESL
jgi:hypothetical protein